MSLTLLLHGKHAGSAVTYEPLGPWLLPWRFRDTAAEYETLRTATGLLDGSTQALIEVQGADRADFLHRLLTNDIARLAPGGGCRACLLDASAKLIADLVVLADPDRLWLLCDLTRAEIVAQTLTRYLFSEQVTVANHERRQAVLALQGPRTMELLAHVIGTVISVPADGDHVAASLHEIPLRLVRHAVAGGVGVWCLVDAADAETVWGLFRDEGQRFGLRLVGWDALNTARIEAGLPWWGLDMDETNLLPETGLERAVVSETKGCYLGQEIIARMQTYGSPSKKLMGLVLEGDETPSRGDRIRRDGEELGHVTSACRSPVLKRPIAMGYVKRGAYEPGTVVEIVRGEGRLSATVAARPLAGA